MIKPATKMKSYNRDPYWTNARFDSIAEDGTEVKRGDRVFYYPSIKKVFIGERAESAAADFAACAQDEAFATGGSY